MVFQVAFISAVGLPDHNNSKNYEKIVFLKKSSDVDLDPDSFGSVDPDPEV